LHGVLVGAGWVQPLDFWRLRPGEIWMILEAHKPRQNPSETNFAELHDMLKKDRVENGASSR